MQQLPAISRGAAISGLTPTPLRSGGPRPCSLDGGGSGRGGVAGMGGVVSSGRGAMLFQQRVGMTKMVALGIDLCGALLPAGVRANGGN